MSLACMRCRARLAKSAAGRTNEAERLEVETHLEGCAACRDEQARWGVIGALGEHEPSLSRGAHERIRQAVLAEAAPISRSTGGRVALPFAGRGAIPPLAPARPRRAFALTAGVALVVGIAFAGALQRRSHAPEARVIAGELFVDGARARVGAAIGPAATLSVAGVAGEPPAAAATPPAIVRLDGPNVALAAGTRATWSRGARTVTLQAGEVRVEVDPGQGRRFRVATSRFAAEVMGTRFSVSLTTVHTERGRVRVLAPDGHELAQVGPGETWTLPAAASPAHAIAAAVSSSPAVDAAVASAASSPPAADPAASPTRAAPPAHGPSTRQGDAPSASVAHDHAGRAGRAVDVLLQSARRALAAGQGGEARSLVKQALAERPPAGLAAEAESLVAESFLVEGDKEEAVRRYLELAHARAELPQGESALFAAAELSVELGQNEAARRDLERYLARFPRGRFRVEAQARLARLAAR